MSDSDHPTTSIIKSDRTGRTRYTRQYKQEVLTAYVLRTYLSSYSVVNF